MTTNANEPSETPVTVHLKKRLGDWGWLNETPSEDEQAFYNRFGAERYSPAYDALLHIDNGVGDEDDLVAFREQAAKVADGWRPVRVVEMR